MYKLFIVFFCCIFINYSLAFPKKELPVIERKAETIDDVFNLYLMTDWETTPYDKKVIPFCTSGKKCWYLGYRWSEDMDEMAAPVFEGVSPFTQFISHKKIERLPETFIIANKEAINNPLYLFLEKGELNSCPDPLHFMLEKFSEFSLQEATIAFANINLLIKHGAKRNDIIVSDV